MRPGDASAGLFSSMAKITLHWSHSQSHQEFPDFLTDLLQHPPAAGEGVHAWLFRVARQLHAHYPASEIVHQLEIATINCGRHVPRNEILQAVQNSIKCAWQLRGGALFRRMVTKWPPVNEQRRSAILADGHGLADLWDASPVRIENNQPHTEEIIDRLFPGDPLLCCGWSQSAFNTRLRSQWRGQLTEMQFIVPSPMIASTGITKDGRQSAHTLANTGRRRFLVVEFDSGSVDEQAALLLHLATYGPLVVAVHSGGKSLHGWFFVQDQPEEKVLKFFRYAVTLGADTATWLRSQFVRMPDGTRNNGVRHTVFFLSVRPLGAI
jgi:hypothetical protein